MCSDGTCVQADGTSWSMMLNGTNSSISSSQTDFDDDSADMSLHSLLHPDFAFGLFPANRASPAALDTGHHHSTTSLPLTTSNISFSCLNFTVCTVEHRDFVTAVPSS